MLPVHSGFVFLQQLQITTSSLPTKCSTSQQRNSSGILFLVNAVDKYFLHNTNLTKYIQNMLYVKTYMQNKPLQKLPYKNVCCQKSATIAHKWLCLLLTKLILCVPASRFTEHWNIATRNYTQLNLHTHINTNKNAVPPIQWLSSKEINVFLIPFPFYLQMPISNIQ